MGVVRAGGTVLGGCLDVDGEGQVTGREGVEVLRVVDCVVVELGGNVAVPISIKTDQSKNHVCIFRLLYS